MGMITKVRRRVGVPETREETPVTNEVVDAESSDTATAETERDVAQTPAKADSKTLPQLEKRPVGNGPLARWREGRERRRLSGQFDAYPHLLALKPKERYVFRSDYFHVDGSVSCILAFFHKDEANDGFAPFWGIARIPDGLDDSVTTVVFEQVEKKDDDWVTQYIKQSERLERLDSNEQASGGTTSSKQKSEKISSDRNTIITEIHDGAAYLSVHNRLLVKAPDLDTLDDSIERISRLYVDRFGTLTAEPYIGEQRQELSTLMRSNERKRGKGFHFTSTEYAGSSSLVTNGLNDKTGEYVGFIDGDVNNSAVLMDVNRYEERLVIADGVISDYLDREYRANMWCSKISQSALLSNHRVVHLVLDGARMNMLGPRMDGITARVDLSSGDVNMFEMFGDQNDELAVYAAQMQKITLMFEQLYETEDESVGSIIRNEMEKMATDFYVDQRMWVHNAQHNRNRLRVVDIPHDQVPRLQLFKSYLDTQLKTLRASSIQDQDQTRAYNVLTGVVSNLLSTNGDLFNNYTVDAIDGVRDSRRVIYDFSELMRRGRGVAMAQLVNIIGFAVGRLERGDVVIIHGTENIDHRVKEYLQMQFDAMHKRGARVVYSYDNVDKMLDDADFNKFDAADYTILGPMREAVIEKYQKLLAQQIPKDLANLVTRRDRPLTYLRRGATNVVFQLDLALGINPAREQERRAMELAAAKAAESAKYETLLTDDKIVPGGNTTGFGDSNEERARAQREAKRALRRKKGQKDEKSESETEGKDRDPSEDADQSTNRPTRLTRSRKGQRGGQ